MPESPEPEPALNATAQASTTDTVMADQDAQDRAEAAFLDALRTYQAGHETDITLGGHCNVRLTECDPYPIGKGKHPRVDAICSQVCLDTIAHCEDYTTEELEFCCANPGKPFRDRAGKVYPVRVCMPSGEPNWNKRCAPGLNP
ncbi:MAG TPA: hypothetical protein VF516_31120 [Kofleriaceae bacterium]